MPETNYVRLKEEASFGQRRTGAALVAVGKVLLWMDLLLVVFVYVGFRGGSDFWLWWVVSEAILGFILLSVGMYIRSHARAVEPPAPK
jgi:hypothetical protein